ncbi:interferon regulatory factor 3 [Bufo bufo]|uniref:interferon regulatory factor 3 n=1 Tax=Bufo bufo TaxID=8384 RepID=UPI001ABE37D2|nr:interferon regulatory factor 3 [Bufo bufo]XP_040289882.1 interferon regulatory factor 3 [Bufo bufo]
MSSQRPRIIPWLLDQINSQKYPGLKWINTEQTQFRIPWKHGLRQDRSEEDVKIFEAWAFVSGSYDPNIDVPNPAVWKRNVRSALNRKTEIRMIRDRSSDSTDPHKIYEIIRGNIAVASEDLCRSDSASPTTDTTKWNSPGSQITVGRNLAQGMTQMQISNDEDLYLAAEDLQSPFEISDLDWYNDMLSPDFAGASASPVCHNNSPYPVHEEQSGQAQTVPVVAQESLQQSLLNQCFPNSTFETQFDVKIYYRGTLVKNTLVKNTNGIHLTSRKQPQSESYLEDVILPPPTAIHDQKVAAEIYKLLENLQLGTVVEVRDGSICAKRLGKCRSFWTMTDTPTIPQPNPIDKMEYCVLYNFQQFVKELIEFAGQKRKESPLYSIWICLGELWPDDRPWKKKLIMVQITPKSMQILHELSYNTGASSLHNSDVNLQISDSLSLSSTSDLLTFLKEFEEKMECS